MLQAEQAVGGGAATGEQEQGHGDAELLLEQAQHIGGLSQPAAPHRSRQTLAWLIGERREELVEPVLQQRLQRRDTADAIKAEIQAGEAGAEAIGQLRYQDPLTEVYAEIPHGLTDHLNRMAATKGYPLIDLRKNGGYRQWVLIARAA